MDQRQAYEDYVCNMQGIYDKFPQREEDLRRLGTEAERMVKVREGCMALVFRHVDAINRTLADYSVLIGEVVPAMVYQSSNIQTTILPFGISDEYRYTDDQAPIVAALVQAAEEALRELDPSLVQSREIEFRRALFSRGVVLVPGYPNFAQWVILNAIVEKVKTVPSLDQSKVRMPWGSQCVVARFAQDVSASDLAELLSLIPYAPIIGISRVTSIEVITNEVMPDGAQVTTTHARIPLP